MKHILQWSPLLLFFTIVFFMWRGLSLDPKKIPSQQIGRPLPAFSLPLLNQPTQIFQATDLPKSSFLLNVWASWCDACRDEQVMLLKLARQSVPIYGLNYKDDPLTALSWLHQWGNPFQAVFIDETGRTGIDLGVYGTPETFVIDQGVVRYRYAGILNERIWEKHLKPLLCKTHPEAPYCFQQQV